MWRPLLRDKKLYCFETAFVVRHFIFEYFILVLIAFPSFAAILHLNFVTLHNTKVGYNDIYKGDNVSAVNTISILFYFLPFAANFLRKMHSLCYSSVIDRIETYAFAGHCVYGFTSQ